jgi:hypothetical protein
VTKLEAQDQSPRQDRFVGHEWGTFTSVSTADGRQQLWNPLSGPSELPSFVYQNSGRCSKVFRTLALVRMETEIRAAAQLFGENSPEARSAAINSVRRYGRFADPVLREAMNNAKDNASRAAIDELMAAMAKPAGQR